MNQSKDEHIHVSTTDGTYCLECGKKFLTTHDNKARDELNLSVGKEFDVIDPTCNRHTRAKITRHYRLNGAEKVEFILEGMSLWNGKPKWNGSMFDMNVKSFAEYIIEDITNNEARLSQKNFDVGEYLKDQMAQARLKSDKAK